MKEPKTLFGRRLRQARLDKGLSQKQLGISAGIDEFAASARVNQYERGTHSPTFDTAKRLANALNVPTAFFYAEDDRLAELIQVFVRLSVKRQSQLLASAAKK